jgi:hypothetical protein
VARFFSAAKITPPWLAFCIRMNRPVQIANGPPLDYTIK